MPCSYCNATTHNISRCNAATHARSIEIYNNKLDPFLRGLPVNWFKNGELYPCDTQWTFRGGTRNVNAAEQNIAYYLSRFRDICGISGRSHVPSYWVVRKDDYIFEYKPDPLHAGKIIARRYGISEGRGVLQSYSQEARRLQNIQSAEARRMAQERREERRLAQLQRERLMQPVDAAVESTECPICLDSLRETNKMILRCGHQYCGDCLFKHFQGKGGTKCPLCRAHYTKRVAGWVPPGGVPHTPASNSLTHEQILTLPLGNILQIIHGRR
jgi:hypothetical protein